MPALAEGRKARQGDKTDVRVETCKSKEVGKANT